MICSASQIDSFWKTLVLSKDCESSMRAIVSDPPFLGVPASEPEEDDEDEELPPDPPQPPMATADSAAPASNVDPILVGTRMSPSSGERLALMLRTVYNTQ